MATSTPAEVYAVLKAVDESHGGKNVAGRVRGTYIVLRESGGKSDAFRDASKNKYGGNDRGWWQFNSKAFPDVPDAVAFDPQASTEKAWQVSKGFVSFGPWKLAGGFDTEKQAAILKTAYEAGATNEGMSFDDFRAYVGKLLGGGGIWDDVLDVSEGVGTVVAGVGEVITSPITTVVDFLQKLLDAALWIRVVKVVGGVVAVVAGVVIFSQAVPTRVDVM